MKYLLTLTLILSAVFSLAAQEKPKNDPTKSSFGTGLDVFSDIWMDLPNGIESKTINQGLNFYVAYRNPIGTGPFATSIGISLGAHNLNSNALLGRDTSGSSIFIPIPETATGGQGNKIEYKRNKLALAYLDLPLELQMKTKKGFFASIGVRAGLLLSAHTKYKGDDISGSGHSTKAKEGDLPNMESYRLGGMVRIGYKMASLYGAYSFSKIFKEELGPDIYPISVGISLRPF